MQFLDIYIDENLLDSQSLFDLIDFMSIGKYNYKIKKQDIPYLITFVRDKLEINSKEDEIDTDQVCFSNISLLTIKIKLILNFNISRFYQK